MFDTFKNAWKVEELRKRLLYTLMILVLFRLGCTVTVPFVDTDAMSQMFSQSQNMLGYLNMMSGGALSQAALFALSVQPYINASIIIQLLTVAIPALEQLQKEGREGQRRLQKITRYTGAGIAVGMGIGYYFVMRNSYGAVTYTEGFSGVLAGIVIVSCFVAGSMLVTWMGERIDDKGIGNGVSMLIFVGIICLCCWSWLWPWWCSWSSSTAPSAASPSNMPSAWWVARCTAVSPPTSPSR